jgi:hypothetical protein
LAGAGGNARGAQAALAEALEFERGAAELRPTASSPRDATVSDVVER